MRLNTQANNFLKIRRYRSTDLDNVEALDGRVQPYRPEDQPAVEAMYRRASAAEQGHDRWVPIPVPREGEQPVTIEDGYLAFWVAERTDTAQIAGMVGVGHVNYEILPADMPYVQGLRERSDFVELQHLRVDPDFHGHGVGTRLCQAVIDWTKENGYRMLLVNTTVPQTPARRLYEKLGFVETVRTFIGRYELVWMEKLVFSSV